MPTINGKKVFNLPSAVTGQELKEVVGESRPGRKVLITRPEGNVSISDYQSVKLSENDKVQIVPDRIKAYEFTYGGKKSKIQKEIIFSQVADIEANWLKSGIEIDKDFNWILVNSFKLPDAWARVNDSPFTKILLVIPDQFPDLPTNGFYMPSTLIVPSGDSHFHSRGYSGAYGSNDDEIRELEQNGWKWYCTHIIPEAWSPARIQHVEDWRKGDNLWDVFTLIRDVLTDPRGE